MSPPPLGGADKETPPDLILGFVSPALVAWRPAPEPTSDNAVSNDNVVHRLTLKLQPTR